MTEGQGQKPEMDAAGVERRTVLAGAAAGLAGLAATAGGAAPAAAQQAGSVPGAQPGVLAGQVALVTGAGRGIGRAIAVALAASGADVVALDIAADIEGHAVPLATPRDLSETVLLVQRQGRRALGIQADIRDLAALERAVARTRSELGRLDVVAANAGVHQAVGFLTEDAAAWVRSVGTNSRRVRSRARMFAVRYS